MLNRFVAGAVVAADASHTGVPVPALAAVVDPIHITLVLDT